MDSITIDRPKQGPACNEVVDADIELVSAQFAREGLVEVVAKDCHRDRSWVVWLEPEALQSFQRFQVAFFIKTRVWADHTRSQDGSNEESRRQFWDSDVRGAFRDAAVTRRVSPAKKRRGQR